MSISRRDFLRIAGFSTLFGLGAKSAFEMLAPGELEAKLAPNPKALTAKRWAMVVDMRKLDEQTAEKCIEACHRIHNVPDFEDPIDPKDKVDPAEKVRWEVKWIWKEKYEHAFPGQAEVAIPEKIHKLNFLLLCNHCDNPPCVRVCPTKATWKRDDGVVMMDQHRCIGCRYCMAACPYGARSFNWRNPRPFIKSEDESYPTREIGVVEKCTLCAERLAKGQLPACVEASKGALTVGDLNDAKSKVRELLRNNFTIRRKTQLGSNPQVYYIV
ncbi:MAG: 4Fe-4S ferredoxin [Deltaproteobacteria bacterium]|nr:MAG: 4Fe-4S ferredoxin [Deltaproteobacteria bacterium]